MREYESLVWGRKGGREWHSIIPIVYSLNHFDFTVGYSVQNLAFHTFSSLSDRYLASGTQLSAQGLDGLVSALESELKFSDSVDGSKYEGQVTRKSLTT